MSLLTVSVSLQVSPWPHGSLLDSLRPTLNHRGIGVSLGEFQVPIRYEPHSLAV